MSRDSFVLFGRMYYRTPESTVWQAGGFDCFKGRAGLMNRKLKCEGIIHLKYAKGISHLTPLHISTQSPYILISFSSRTNLQRLIWKYLTDTTLQLLKLNWTVFSFAPHSQTSLVGSSSLSNKGPEKSLADPCKTRTQFPCTRHSLFNRCGVKWYNSTMSSTFHNERSSKRDFDQSIHISLLLHRLQLCMFQKFHSYPNVEWEVTLR